MQKNIPYCNIFIFINNGSGGGVGQQLVNQKTGNKQDQIVVEFYNLRKNKDEGFNKLKNFTDNNKKVIVVVGGGDGTIMWVVSQFIKNNIDSKKAPLTVIPLGTGNDFSRCLGWGKQQTTLTQNSYQTLKILIRDWIYAEEQDLDIWHIQAKVYNYGKFQKVVDQKDHIIPQKIISKNFCNYFSFGIDGKVGYEFDKYRTKSRNGNFAVYTAMGIVSNLSSNKTLGELLDYVIQENPQKDSVEVIYKGQKVKSAKQLFGNNIFNLKFNFQDIVDNVKNSFSLNNFQNVVALNINSYMAGVKDIWKKAGEANYQNKSDNIKQSSYSDGLIQLVSFASTAKIGLQKVTNKITDFGFSQKFGQGKGPFIFKFRKQQEKTQNETYLQIDGQFIKVSHLNQIKLQKSVQIPKGKIRVLKRKL